MANSQLNGERHAYASIDTAPGAGGYWSQAVSLSAKGVNALFLSRSGGGSGTVTLQFKLPHSGSAWTDFITDEDLSDGARLIMDDWGAGVKWRAGMKEDTSASPTYTSGTIIVGFDW